MNKKEKIVLFFLCFTFFIGIGINIFKQYKEKRNLSPIAVKKISNDIIIDDDVIDTSYETNLININTASNKELEALPGIGPVIAQRIVEYRQKNDGFKNKEELLKVSGIGTKKLSTIKDKIIVR